MFVCHTQEQGLRRHLGEAGVAKPIANQLLHVQSIDVVYAWRNGWPLTQIGRFANAAGALCVQQIGATAGLGNAHAILQFAAQADAARLPG